MTGTSQLETKPPQVPVQVFQEMELMDETQILREMKGELLEEFVYDIEIQGRRVTNLSYQGVKEAIRRRGKYEILDVHVEEDKDQYRCLVRVRDLIRQIDVLGASTCEKPKPFSYTLAINKAERNAYRKLIPEKLIAAMVKEFLERKKTRTVSGPVSDARAPLSEAGARLSQAGISPKPEIPVPASPSPAPAIPVQTKPGSAWKVPRTKDQATSDQIQSGVKQFPLLRDLKSFGMINTLGEEISIIPERPVPIDTPLIDGFLIRKIIEPMIAKHGLAYTIQRANNGFLEAVLIRGKLEDQQLKELVSGARWAFERALEEKKP